MAAEQVEKCDVVLIFQPKEKFSTKEVRRNGGREGTEGGVVRGLEEFS